MNHPQPLVCVRKEKKDPVRVYQNYDLIILVQRRPQCFFIYDETNFFRQSSMDIFSG